MTKASFQAFCRNYTGTALEAMADAHALCDLQNAASGDIAARLGAISGLPPAVAVQVAWNGTDTDLDTYFNAGVAILRSLGTNAHVWLPGANGVSVASLPSNNYLLSDGSTGYSTVDGVDGLTLDGMGTVSSTEKVVNGTNLVTTTGWAAGDSASLSVVGGNLRVTNGASAWGYAHQAFATVAGKSYVLAPCFVSTTSSASTNVNIGISSGGNGIAGSVDTSKQKIFVAIGALTYISLYANDGVAGHYTDFGNISVKEYTGIHLTQPTTANKPLVRRGMLNLLTYSHTLTNAAWTKVGATTAPSATTISFPNTNEAILNPVTITAPAGSKWTAALLLSGTGTTTISVGRYTGGAYEEATLQVTLTATPTLYAVPLTLVGAQTAMFSGITRKPGNTATTVTCDGGLLVQGLFTAAQILAEGGIPTTTATAASNPTSGKYWWSFDGSNDSLLSGNLGITNACTIVIAGLVNSLPGVVYVVAGEDVNGAQVTIYADGSFSIDKTGVGTIARSAAGLIVAGVPFVITARLSDGTAVVRLNGLQVATAASALTYSATTGMRIGSKFDSSFPLNGAIGWVVPLPAALSDADCLTVERLVSSQFPNGPVF